MSDLEYHPAGDSDSDIGETNQQLEGSIQTFGNGDSLRKSRGGAEEAAGEQGPGGDSRPDRVHGEGGFVDITDDASQRVGLDRPTPNVNKESAETLAATRVDQEDTIVAEPDPITGEEVAILRKTNPVGSSMSTGN